MKRDTGTVLSYPTMMWVRENRPRVILESQVKGVQIPVLLFAQGIDVHS